MEWWELEAEGSTVLLWRKQNEVSTALTVEMKEWKLGFYTRVVALSPKSFSSFRPYGTFIINFMFSIKPKLEAGSTLRVGVTYLMLPIESAS